MTADYQIRAYETSDVWRAWLETHHADAVGMWIKIYKKGSGIATVTYAEALDQALCFGWIDGQRKSGGEQYFLQKFTPRRKASLWSKRNIGYVERLTAAGLMTPAGQAEVDRAKQDGRWAAAYDMQRTMQVPDDFMQALQANPSAKAFFETLNKSNLFAIGFRVHTAKTEATRQRRIAKIIDTLADGQKLV